MNLREYLARDGSLTPSEIRQRMNAVGAQVKDDAQIRQWASEPQPGRPNRRPDAANCHCLELATNGKVRRQDMRPHDYAVIWPELAPVRKKAKAQ